MANHAVFSPDLLIAEKLCAGRWLVEPATGNIYSKDSGKYLKPSIISGYPRVAIGSTYVLLSRVVWIAVHGIPELPYLQIDHINEDKLDNRIENLRLITAAGNTRHSKARLTYEELESIKREYAKGGVTQKELAEKYRTSRRNISRIIHEERYNVPERLAEINEETKVRIFNDVCCKGNRVDSVAVKYKVSRKDVLAAIDEQSLKIELARRNE